MTSINVRSIDEKMLNSLKKSAQKQKVSVNSLILTLLKQGLGLSQRHQHTTYHDLDNLAGTWTKQDDKEFSAAVSDFDRIDESLWK